jgi:hypothetical protein
LDFYKKALFKPGSARPDPDFAEFDRNTSIYAVEPDGTGGYYIGGIIPSYNGVKLNNDSSAVVIHILADNTLDPAFKPTNLAGFYVSCLKKQGNRLYIGGHFYNVNGVDRTSLAALNAATGEVLNWIPEEVDLINKIEATDSLVFIQGDFFSVGEHIVPGFATILPQRESTPDTILPIT